MAKKNKETNQVVKLLLDLQNEMKKNILNNLKKHQKIFPIVSALISVQNLKRNQFSIKKILVLEVTTSF